MAQFPSLPIFTDAFIADTTHLSAAETGAYIMLLMCAWRRPNCDLPNDDKLLAKFARCTPTQWRRIKDTVLDFWHLEDGFLKQKKLSNVHKTVSLNSKVAKRNAEARWLKEKKTHDADASVSQCSPKPKPNKKDIRDTNVSLVKTDGFDASTFVSIWNDICGREGLSKVRDCKGNRLQKARKRWKEDFNGSFEEWAEFCRRVAASDFLAGRQTSWSAGFDWCLEPANLTKALEGNYDNRSVGSVVQMNGSRAPRSKSAEIYEARKRREERKMRDEYGRFDLQ